METVSNGCPTGILIDVDLQTDVLNNKKENEKQLPIKNNKEKNSVANGDSSNSCTSHCFLDQSPPKTPSVLKTNTFFTPKSNWKTPSPKSMKIISHDASRIIDQLYSSPINCSEVMIYDEVFPVVKSLDDACFDEFQVNSESLSVIDINATHEEVDQNNPNSFDLINCTSCANSNCTSCANSNCTSCANSNCTSCANSNCTSCANSNCTPENIVCNEKLSTLVRQSDMKPVQENDSISEKTTAHQDSSIQKSCVESVGNDKKNVKSGICIVNSTKQEVTTPKTLPAVVKGFGIKKSIKHFSTKDKENEFQSDDKSKYGSNFSKKEKSYNNTENKTKGKNQCLKEESMLNQSSMKCDFAKYSVLGNKNAKDIQSLDHSDNRRKPKAMQQKSNIGRSQSLLCKKDPLYKTETLLGTSVVETSVRRFHSFHYGSTKKAIPVVEEKNISTTGSYCNVLKPKGNLNQVSNNGNGFSTPLQFRRSSQNFKLIDSFSANPTRRKSLAFNSNHSLLPSGIKDAARKDQHSTTKKSAVTFSSRLGFGKNLGMQSSHSKLKTDSLPRKLFP